MINDMVSYAETESMGLGIFTIRDIIENTQILCDPIRTFVGQDAALLKKTDAYRMLFVDRDRHSSEHNIAPLHLVVGPITMLNHSNDANCWLQWNMSEYINSSKIILFSKRYISAGEELFIKYHNVEEYDI